MTSGAHCRFSNAHFSLSFVALLVLSVSHSSLSLSLSLSLSAQTHNAFFGVSDGDKNTPDEVYDALHAFLKTEVDGGRESVALLSVSTGRPCDDRTCSNVFLFFFVCLFVCSLS